MTTNTLLAAVSMLCSILLTNQVSAAPCTVTSCNYSPDVARADCDGRLIRCIPTNFPMAITIDLRQNEITRISVNAFAGHSRLQTVDLSTNKIFNIEDGAFMNLRSLTTLMMGFNRINRIGISTFQGLWGLQTLHLNGNSITSIHENAFRGLPMIKELNLAGNTLSALPDAVFTPLTNLRKLFLQENQLVSSPNAKYLVGLSNLMELDLDGNRFTALPNFSGLVRLGDLDVTDTFISVVPNNSFNHLGHVRDLILSSNKIEVVEPAAFVGLGNLGDFDLSFNLITELHEDTFKPMLGLERLVLSNNMITTLNPQLFAQLYRLRILLIENNHLKIVPPMYGLRSLQTLSLKSNYLTTFDSTAMGSMPALNKIQLFGNPLQCDCRLRTLRQWYLTPPVRHRPFEIPVCDIPATDRGKRLTAMGNSDLKCTPPTISYTSGREISSLSGQNITLQCVGQGFPTPDILWYSPSRMLIMEGANTDKFTILDDGRLVITRTAVEDRGDYRCVAKNPAGQVAQAVRLFVRPPNTNPPGTEPNRPAGTPTNPVAGATNPETRPPTDPTTRNNPPRATMTPTITADPPRNPFGPKTPLAPSRPRNPTGSQPNHPGTEPNDPYNDDAPPPRNPNRPFGKPHTPLSPKYDPSPDTASGNPPTTEENIVVSVPDGICRTESARVAVAVLTTFILTGLLAFMVFWLWHNRYIHKVFKHGKRRVTLISLRRRLSSKRPRHIVPVHMRCPRAYSTVEDQYTSRTSSFTSDTEDSASTASSYESSNRYVLTESVADPDSIKGKAQTRRHAIIEAFRNSTDSTRHTYQNAAMVVHDPNYSALWPGSRSKDRTGLNNHQSADSRIYMDLS